MSILHKAIVECTCGENFEIQVFSTLNIAAQPKFWPSIYANTINSGICKKCSKRIYWPETFIFFDTERKVIFHVLMKDFVSKEYMISHTINFINNYDSWKHQSQLPNLTGYTVAAVMNIEDLKSKIHADMGNLDISELQFMEYVLEMQNSCDECSSNNLKMIFERIENNDIVFKTICLDCAKISLANYPIENYKKVIESAKLANAGKAASQVQAS